MNLDEYRARAAERRRLAPTLYGSHGLDTGSRPESIRPPEWMCDRHASSWRRWADYTPYVPIVLMSIGTPLPREYKRRTTIGEQREVITAICRERCHDGEVPA